MDKESVEESVIDIDIINPIDSDDVTILQEETIRSTDEADVGVSISGSAIGTGNLISQVFNLISQIRNKSFWKLNDSEIKNLNNTCPKIIPEILSKHSGIISCILNIIGIIIKRLKLEKEEIKTNEISEEPETEIKSLIGGRSG